ncbi:MAG: response regulator transcription factor [Bacteroidetes bacterium]|nr:response regulator transcription factor [Bacteroidota bacterium]
MTSAIIIDDEQNNIDNLSLLLGKHCPDIGIVATALNADTGMQKIKELSPDIIFLDIQMPAKSGLTMLEEMPALPSAVIFVTAYDQYAIQAFRFSAVDYLLKPINVSELKSAVEKAIAGIRNKNLNLHLENLVNQLRKQQNKDVHRIALSSLKETRFVYTREILYCEAANNYSTFFLIDGEKIIVSKPIYEYDAMLRDYGFIRCHQSFLVNKAHVRSFIKEDGGSVLLNNKTHIPVSRSKRDELKRALE